MALSIQPLVGEALTYTSADVSLPRRGFQSVRGYITQPVMTLQVSRFMRAELPKLAALAVTAVQQQTNRASVFQVVSRDPAQLCVITYDLRDRALKQPLQETFCGVFEIGDAAVDGFSESLSLILYRCNRLITPAGVQTRGLE